MFWSHSSSRCAFAKNALYLNNYFVLRCAVTSSEEWASTAIHKRNSSPVSSVCALLTILHLWRGCDIFALNACLFQTTESTLLIVARIDLMHLFFEYLDAWSNVLCDTKVFNTGRNEWIIRLCCVYIRGVSSTKLWQNMFPYLLLENIVLVKCFSLFLPVPLCSGG